MVWTEPPCDWNLPSICFRRLRSVIGEVVELLKSTCDARRTKRTPTGNA